jgi:hypothetical protein
MFEGLDEIDWHQLKHAYGAADDVPKWLRALLAQEDESNAFTLLSLSLCHQGTVYSAPAHAVPFIIELLTSKSMQSKDVLLRLLAGMAHEEASHYQHYSHYSEVLIRDLTFQQELADEFVWAERTYEAIRQGLPVYLELLSDIDPRIRIEAAYILAQLRVEAATILPVLCLHLEQEHYHRARASMLLGLGVLGGPTVATRSLIEPLLTMQREEEQALVRYSSRSS